jgi:hypothetical protein
MFVAVSEMMAQWFGADRTSDMAQRVAGRSRLTVWHRVMHRLPTLGATEGRGYLRARAIPVVREETMRLIEQEGTNLLRQQTEIEEMAIQFLIETISAQIVQPRSHAQGRRAA